MLLSLCLLACAAAFAQAPQPAKVTVRLGGVGCDGCVPVLREALQKAPGIKFDPAGIRVGEKPKYFSDAIALEIADLGKTDLGALAKAVAETKTPCQKEAAPSLNLVLFGIVDEPAVNALRAALVNVAGIDANGAGTIGGLLTEDTFWVRLNASGEARLADICDALKRAGPRGVTLERP
jgi:hypothetical protein